MTIDRYTLYVLFPLSLLVVVIHVRHVGRGSGACAYEGWVSGDCGFTLKGQLHASTEFLLSLKSLSLIVFA